MGTKKERRRLRGSWGIRHVAEVARVGEEVFENVGFVSTNPGAKVVRSFFDAAHRMARHELVCYANCDIVLSRDFFACGERGGCVAWAIPGGGQKLESRCRNAAGFWREAVGAVVVDASEAVMAVHQNHDYGYHPAGKAGVWTRCLERNYELAGGRWHLRTIDDATHLLGPSGRQAHPARGRRAAARDAAWLPAME